MLQAKVEQLVRLIKQCIDYVSVAFAASPWLKLALVSFMGMLGGTTFVAFINKYAVYNYMLAYGARLPLEGVQFLDVAVSVMSFLVVFASLLSLFFAYGFMSLLANALHKMLSYFSLKKSAVSILSKMVASIIAVVISSSISIFDFVVKIFGFKTTMKNDVLPATDITSLLVYSLVIAAFISLLVYKRAIKYFSICLTIASFVFISVSLFDAEKYSTFLNEIQYGGGVPVKVILKDKTEINGNLIISTRDSMILWESESQEYIDVSKSELNSYHVKTLSPTKMPEKNGLIWDMFTHFV
ncbi:hypothetical protein D0784_09640 [Vibrio campbellii]|nr:hypothetical protein D0784_09640 [Vibrio campbellii]HAS6217567.1 hypothetical protein [Vibrio vulnificus]